MTKLIEMQICIAHASTTRRGLIDRHRHDIVALQHVYCKRMKMNTGESHGNEETFGEQDYWYTFEAMT